MGSRLDPNRGRRPLHRTTCKKDRPSWLKTCPFGGVNRRQFLRASVAAAPLISVAPSLAAAQGPQVTGSVTHQGGDGKPLSKLALPGLYPGQGLPRKATRRCAGTASGTPPAIKTTLERGMKELTGATDAVEAWKHFFEPGDVVGIKVVPGRSA